MPSKGSNAVLNASCLQSTANVVVPVPANCQNLSNAEIAAFLAGLPIYNSKAPATKTKSNGTTVSPLNSNCAFRNYCQDILSDHNVVPSVDSNQIVTSVRTDRVVIPSKTNQLKANAKRNSSIIPITQNEVVSPVSTNQVLTAIGPEAPPTGLENVKRIKLNATGTTKKTPRSQLKTHTETKTIASPVKIKKVTTSTSSNKSESLNTNPVCISAVSNPINLKEMPPASPSAISSETVTLDNSTNNVTDVVSPNTSNKAPPTNVVPLGTLVFFDLETTGLGYMIGKSNVQITEISMVAVNRKEFLECKSSDLHDLRIIHKLSMCVKPRSSVAPGAADITGLNNFNLANQYPFDENTATAIIVFLSRLHKPVCLLAHNGNSFDFPLIKAEMMRICMDLPHDLLIADTLSAFRAVGIPEAPLDRKVCKYVKYGKTGRISLSLQNLYLFFFDKNPTGGHSSEGDCIALARVCHKVKDSAIPWIEAHARSLDSVVPMW